MQTLVRFWSAILDLCSQIAHLKVSLRDSDRLPGLSPVGGDGWRTGVLFGNGLFLDSWH